MDIELLILGACLAFALGYGVREMISRRQGSQEAERLRVRAPWARPRQTARLPRLGSSRILGGQDEGAGL